jgi:hypothetical protein
MSYNERPRTRSVLRFRRAGPAAEAAPGGT